MTTETTIQLHAAELSALWGTYLNDSMSNCILTYFLATNEDAEFAPVIEFALSLARQHVQAARDMFTKEGIPVPVGFTDEDVFVRASRLYSDPFHMYYISEMAKTGLGIYGFALAHTTRSDVRAFYTACIQSATELYNRTAELLLAKGLYIKPPLISYPDKIEFVTKQHFLDGLLGRKRTLTATEITHLFANMDTNAVGHSLLLGFSQTAKDTKVRKHLATGVEIAKKHMDVFAEALQREEINAPTGWAQHVEDSTEPPFSDKLMAYHAVFLTGLSIGNYGMAFGNSPRKDIAIDYARLIEEIAEYGNDGANLLIANEWLEEPPRADDRKALMK